MCLCASHCVSLLPHLCSGCLVLIAINLCAERTAFPLPPASAARSAVTSLLGDVEGCPSFSLASCGRCVLPRLQDATVRPFRLERHVQDMFIHILTVLWLEKQEPYRVLLHLD